MCNRFFESDYTALIFLLYVRYVSQKNRPVTFISTVLRTLRILLMYILTFSNRASNQIWNDYPVDILELPCDFLKDVYGYEERLSSTTVQLRETRWFRLKKACFEIV